MQLLLPLNLALAAKEANGHPVTAHGLPPDFPELQTLVTEDCIQL